MNSQNLPITGPCPIDLDAIGFDRKAKKAHCAHCDKSVHNLSNMTRAEARAFLRENAGTKLCVSYSRGRDGTIAFRSACGSEPTAAVVPLARVRSSARRTAMPAAATLGLAAALAACTPHGPDPSPRPTPTQIDQHQRPEVEPDPVPMAGAAVIPEPAVVEGELEVPEAVEMGEAAIAVEPDATPDEPCDKTKTGG